MHNLFPLLAQTSTQIQDDGAAAALGVIIVFSAAFVIIGIFFILPLAFLFKKAGLPAWAALVPIYNMYIWLKMLGRGTAATFGGFILVGVLSAVPILNILLAPLFTILSFVLTYEVALVFGQSPGFGIAHAVFTPFTNLYLAFSGDVQYQGPLAGARNRVLLEPPWIDPTLAPLGVDTYGGYTAQAPGNVGGYQPPVAPSQPPVPPSQPPIPLQQPPTDGNGFGQFDDHGFSQ
ncbi:DUF5684 domain-containing protein [Stomatohabitans albus]|uniref:DUF5684 domain-containing protein n=1 Tax=Stomatohabitans albus TaxID=3110766 RepID=UPI00300D0D55